MASSKSRATSRHAPIQIVDEDTHALLVCFLVEELAKQGLELGDRIDSAAGLCVGLLVVFLIVGCEQQPQHLAERRHRGHRCRNALGDRQRRLLIVGERAEWCLPDRADQTRVELRDEVVVQTQTCARRWACLED